MAFCSKCGAQINEGAQFCPKCGQPINAVRQQVHQQQFVEQEEETMKTWEKIIYFLIGPIGFIGGLFYVLRKKSSKAKSAFLWAAIGTAVTVVYLFVANSGVNGEPEYTTKQLMVEEFKEQGLNLVVKDLNLVHKSGNEYSGSAECSVDGEPAQYALKVIYDGHTVRAEWELSAIRGDAFDDEAEEDSSVSSSQANDIAEAGYKAGYEWGFNMADLDYDEPDAKQSFSILYGAPSTHEEKQMFNIYKENYERGYREGRRAGRE